MANKLHPLFEIGKSYRDRKGEYTVVAINGNRIQTRRGDGIGQWEDAKTKAHIHRNMLSESTGNPTHVGSGSSRKTPGQKVLDTGPIELSRRAHMAVWTRRHTKNDDLNPYSRKTLRIKYFCEGIHEHTTVSWGLINLEQKYQKRSLPYGIGGASNKIGGFLPDTGLT